MSTSSEDSPIPEAIVNEDPVSSNALTPSETTTNEYRGTHAQQRLNGLMEQCDTHLLMIASILDPKIPSDPKSTVPDLTNAEVSTLNKAFRGIDNARKDIKDTLKCRNCMSGTQKEDRRCLWEAMLDLKGAVGDYRGLVEVLVARRRSEFVKAVGKEMGGKLGKLVFGVEIEVDGSFKGGEKEKNEGAHVWGK